MLAVILQIIKNCCNLEKLDVNFCKHDQSSWLNHTVSIRNYWF